jgi:hypothetical protein
MTQEVKKMIQQYRQKTRPVRSEVLTFRVSPEERELLVKVFGSPTGIRDFALASTDTSDDDLDLKYRLKTDKADEDADKR